MKIKIFLFLFTNLIFLSCSSKQELITDPPKGSSNFTGTVTIFSTDNEIKEQKNYINGKSIKD